MSKNKFDVVLIGDSRVYRGIDPEVLDSITGLKAFNFGFSSASPDSFLISKALRLLDPKGPKIIVLGVSANSFLSASTFNEHYKMIEAWSYKDKWMKSNLYPHLGCFDNRGLSDLYKAYKGEYYYETFHLNSGYAESRKVPLDSNAALPAYKKQFQTEKYSHEKAMAFKRHVMNLRNMGYKVLLLRMPVTHEMLRLEDQATDDAIPKLLKDMSMLGIEVFEAIDFHNLCSYDGSHLDAASSMKYSTQLAHYLIENK